MVEIFRPFFFAGWTGLKVSIPIKSPKITLFHKLLAVCIVVPKVVV